MKRIIFFVSLLVAGFLTACGEEGSIPMVGELRAIVMGSPMPVTTLSPAAMVTSTPDPLLAMPTVIPTLTQVSQPAFNLLYFYANW